MVLAGSGKTVNRRRKYGFIARCLLVRLINFKHRASDMVSRVSVSGLFGVPFSCSGSSRGQKVETHLGPRTPPNRLMSDHMHNCVTCMKPLEGRENIHTNIYTYNIWTRCSRPPPPGLPRTAQYQTGVRLLQEAGTSTGERFCGTAKVNVTIVSLYCSWRDGKQHYYSAYVCFWAISYTILDHGAGDTVESVHRFLLWIFHFHCEFLE